MDKALGVAVAIVAGAFLCDFLNRRNNERYGAKAGSASTTPDVP